MLTGLQRCIHSLQQLLVPKFTPDTGKEWKGDRSELCNQKLLWDVPQQHGELLPLGKQIQVPVQQSPTLHPGHLHSIPPPAHPGTQEVPERRALALVARAGELQPAHPALYHTARGPLQHRASPHTRLHFFQRVY